jgi:flagellar biosynthetic protein FlhB
MGKEDDKTEKPTPKKKKESRKQGQVAKSQDLAGWVIIFATSALLPHLFRTASGRLTGLFASVAQVMSNPSPNGALEIFDAGLRDVPLIVLPILAELAAIGLVVNVAQTGLLFSLHSAAPKFDHLNPMTGVKRLVSTQSLWTLAKQIVRLSILVVAAYSLVTKLGHRLVGSRPASLSLVLSYTATTILSLVREVAALGVLLALIDYGVQRHKLNKKLKMSKREIKEEYRQSEGDPMVKGRMRRQQMKMSRSRMMAAVIGADLVVTNPTHYAIALRYESGAGRAPRVVAKGADEMAMRIREQAKDHHVPVVEDAPLARAIYAVCDVDDQIPRELFVAVARLLAFVFMLPTIVKRSGAVLHRPTSALVA